MAAGEVAPDRIASDDTSPEEMATNGTATNGTALDEKAANETTYCWYNHADCKRYDITYYLSTGRQACKDLCMEMPRCKSITHTTGWSICHLKHTKCTESEMSLSNKNHYCKYI